MIQEELTKSILAVYDENGQEIAYETAEIKLATSKFSSSHKLTNTLFLDNTPYRKDKTKIKYRCQCGAEHIIYLCKFLQKQHLCCAKCRETQEKKQWHSEVLKKLHRKESYTPRTIKTKRVYDFENETDEFKQDFYTHFLTEDEFEKAKKYIYSINNVIIENKNVIFLPHENGTNVKKYRQMVMVDNIKIPFQNIRLKCALCGDIFSITRPLKERIRTNNFDCKTCYLNNKTFAVKKYKNCLTYQGQMELNFIKQCESYGIDIVNGPKIQYQFDNKTHVYNVDFYLPKLNLLIEIKDNHIWHRKQIANGKWGAKETAAKNFCENHKLNFHLLFPKDIDNFFKTLKEIV